MTQTAVYAAGGVVWRLVEGKLKILLIHRTAYADVTLPKGKVDPGETLAETAAREIFEETGIRVALGIPVGVSRYRMPKGREKIVHYWAAEATYDAIRASAFVPNKEIAALEWVKKAYAASMKERGGSIVNVASIAGLRPAPGIAMYGVSKAAVIHLTEELAVELGPTVRVNAVAPGWVRTDMNAAVRESADMVKAIEDDTALGRFGESADIAAVVAFLVSDRAQWITTQSQGSHWATHIWWMLPVKCNAQTLHGTGKYACIDP